jgi:hypothetical protein
MALVSVYDADGVEHQKETVDARECVQGLGYTYDKVEEKHKKERVVKEEVKEPSVILEDVISSNKSVK